LQHFAGLLADDTRFIVPGDHADWSTGEILAMDYVAAQPIETVESADEVTRTRVAHDLIDLTLSELFTHGVMQTDPNFANYRYDPTQVKIVLLDFGATRWIAPEVLGQYRQMLRAGLEMDIEAVAQVATAMGALPEDCAPQHRARLMRMMHMAFESLSGDAPYDFAVMTLSRQMQAEGIALAEDGFLPPPVPMDVLYVQRKLAGMFLLAARLRSKLPLRKMISEHVE
jgi:predicted unusual protein kinase regulating ubiquinone biosynthesis (AarF/ABC1/UbiB family)